MGRGNGNRLQHYLNLYQRKDYVRRYIQDFNTGLPQLRQHWLSEVSAPDGWLTYRGLRAFTLNELKWYIYRKVRDPSMNFFPALTNDRIYFLFLERTFAVDLCM